MPSKSGKESPGLTQEQMLWGVLALLSTAVVCFGAGILVNKIQSKPQVAVKEVGEIEPLPGASETPRREPPRNDRARETGSERVDAEGVQVSPAPVALPPGNSTETAPPSRTVMQREPNTQTLPAPPPRRENKRERERADEPESPPTQEAPAAPSPQTDTPPPEGVAEEPATPVMTPDQDVAVKDETPAATKSGFTIQVGSFDTMANAETFKKTVEAKSDFAVALFPVKDSNAVKACVGTYDTKEAAAKDRAALDRIKDFKGCFVKALSEL